MLPTLIEEGLASINGHKLAKNVLSPENLKKLDKLNAKCWLTYVGLSVGTTLGTIVASKTRDNALSFNNK